MGYFTPGNSGNWYIGIWYGKVSVPTIVWVANRDKPLLSISAGDLRIGSDGNLVLLDELGRALWSTNAAGATSESLATLLDSGNLVLKQGNDSEKLRLNRRTRQNQFLTSWTSSKNPSPGHYSAGFNPQRPKELSIWEGNVEYWASGPRNDHFFTSSMTKVVLTPLGHIHQYTWIHTTQEWNVFSSQPRPQCDVYALCGAYGICDNHQGPSLCSCIQGFEPNSSELWDQRVWRTGCVRKAGLRGVKLPDSPRRLFTNGSMRNCEAACLTNCSCLAYSLSDKAGCSVWDGDLKDLKSVWDDGEDIFIRVAASHGNGLFKILLALIIVVATVLLGTLACCMRKRRQAKHKNGSQPGTIGTGIGNGKQGKALELPLGTILAATNYFSEVSKLGEGGFGPVYKGNLHEGQVVAFKRLSKSSGQGLEEFKNEVILIAKLQHRNLVRLLGCCVQGEEKILVYEYMPNGSLDAFLFDPSKGAQLDWGQCFNIIVGVARGLLYLHQDSRLTIIHRDLKASNILLDFEMNPKISDFGLARIVSLNQGQANTNRVVGTYGYLAPEYVMHGHFSTKSDIFSFGVLLLEIVSRKKTKAFYDPELNLSLLGCAWNLWREGRGFELIDPSLRESCRETRPTMSSIVSMLGNEMASLPSPTQPAFAFGTSASVINNGSSGEPVPSRNMVTMSAFVAR
ncbi:hypothetical protein AMTRI_Chr07g24200 [Amborella trichopoda]